MKLTVLIDNHTLIDRYFIGEPGVSYHIEIDGKKILFDVGYSDAFLKNAAKMDIDLCDIDAVVLSHAHLDHTWGLQHLIQVFAERQFEGLPYKRPVLIAHPSVFDRRHMPGVGDIGCLVSKQTAGQYVDLHLTAKPHWLHPKLVFLGEIERNNDYEACNPIGRIWKNGMAVDDFLWDDSSLACQTTEGLVVIAGCAHAGICNTVTQAMKLCGENRLLDIIGGFHLLDPPERQLRKTVEKISRWQPQALHACHCTDLASRLALSKAADLKEVGVGLVLTYHC